MPCFSTMKARPLAAQSTPTGWVRPSITGVSVNPVGIAACAVAGNARTAVIPARTPALRRAVIADLDPDTQPRYVRSG